MTTDLMYHIHFGPGKLGLGFVLPTIKEMQLTPGLQTVLAARQGDLSRSGRPERASCYEAIRDQREYQLFIQNKDQRTTRDIQDIDLVYTDDDHPELLLKYLAHPNTVLITTALGLSGLADVTILLERGLRQRSGVPGASDLIIIACENPPLNSSQLRADVTEKLGIDADKVLRGVSFIDALVDRVCPAHCRIIDGRVIVESVETFRQWVVLETDESRQSGGLARILAPPIRVISSAPEFDFLEKRKAWLVNGTHLAIAFFARAKGINSLQRALESPYVLSNVQAVQDGAAEALFHYGHAHDINTTEGEISNINQFKEAVLERTRNGPEDYPDRILADWLEWRDPRKLRSFLQKSILRSIEPIEELVQADVLAERPKVASALTQLLIHKIRLLENTDYGVS